MQTHFKGRFQDGCVAKQGSLCLGLPRSRSQCLGSAPSHTLPVSAHSGRHEPDRSLPAVWDTQMELLASDISLAQPPPLCAFGE